jgi:hypothetical protein
MKHTLIFYRLELFKKTFVERTNGQNCSSKIGGAKCQLSKTDVSTCTRKKVDYLEFVTRLATERGMKGCQCY